MTHFIAEIILAAGNSDEDNTFWIQMLVLVVLGGVVGIISLIRTRAKRFKTQQEQHRSVGSGGPYGRRDQRIKAVKDKYVEFFLKTAQPKTGQQIACSASFISAMVTAPTLDGYLRLSPDDPLGLKQLPDSHYN